MQNFASRIAENILPLSVGSTLPEAFEEWSFTEKAKDYEDQTETCQLCDQEGLRYHFEIKNALTKKVLWVGSHCINKFNLSVFENNVRLSPDEAKKKLDRIAQKMRLDSCLKALEKLATTENNDILTNALKFYKKNKYLTPKFAFVVLWRLKKHKIDHSPSFFKINIQKEKSQRHLREMPLDHVHMIWPALSSSQRKKAIAMGHTPPKA